MIRFNNDYNHGAHPEILKALQETSTESYGGYGRDPWCEKAREAIRGHLGNADVDIHFMIGGTQVNAIALSAFLRPYQSIISATNGHINLHEAGAVEHTGHKIVALPGVDGKLTAELIAAEAKEIAVKNINQQTTEKAREQTALFAVDKPVGHRKDQKQVRHDRQKRQPRKKRRLQKKQHKHLKKRYQFSHCHPFRSVLRP